MHATISNEFLMDSLHFVNLFKSLQRCIIICIDGKHIVYMYEKPEDLDQRDIELNIVNNTMRLLCRLR